MRSEPTYLEMFLTKLAFLFYGRAVYKAFADRLPLHGGERVLDFGCGMGTVAYYVEKKLPRGYLVCLDISERWLKACRKTLRDYENVTILRPEALSLPKDSFDVAYCHFVLHDIPEGDLENIIPALVKSLKSGGTFVFREPLNEAEKLNAIKRLIEQSSLALKDSRVTDVPLMGNALESTYIKNNGEGRCI